MQWSIHAWVVGFTPCLLLPVLVRRQLVQFGDDGVSGVGDHHYPGGWLLTRQHSQPAALPAIWVRRGTTWHTLVTKIATGLDTLTGIM
jgi:hypothetical protein